MQRTGTKLTLPELTKRQLEIVTIIQDAGEIGFRELVEKMQKPPADRTVRDELARLKTLGLIDSKSFGRGALWYPLVK